LRAKLVDILRSAFNRTSVETSEETKGENDWALECALRLENEIYRLFKAGKLYNDKARSVLFNLQDVRNKKASQMLLKKTVSPEEFLQLDPKEYAGEEQVLKVLAAEKTSFNNSRTDWAQEEVLA
jgi:hypothetical protein